jgi:tetratricopeptide (TPR) repeat protein
MYHRPMNIGVVALLAVMCTIVAAEPAQRATKPGPTRAQLKSGRAHMKAGWAAQHAKKWSDATKEFEAALVNLGGDARAMSELGWSAMNAGDYVKAKKADEAAILTATDPKVKAASLFNLGLVQERLEDKDGALRSFAMSLSLRPNQTVGDEAVKLGAKAGAPPPPFCAGDKPICTCLKAQFPVEDATCDVSTTVKSPIKGWTIYAVKSEMFSSTYLVDDHKELLAELTSEHDSMRSTSTDKVDEMTVKTVGGHKVLWIQVTDHASSMSMTETDEDDSTEDTVTITACAVGDAKIKTHCEDAPTKIVSEQGSAKLDADGNMHDAKSSSSETEMAVTLTADGVFDVKLTKGSLGSYPTALLGPHKLF